MPETPEMPTVSRRWGAALAVPLLLLAALVPAGGGARADAAAAAAPKVLEFLDRGLVAVKVTTGAYLSWRFLGDEPDDVSFRVYRDGTRVATVTNSSNYTDPAGTTTSSYAVAAVVAGTERARSAAVRPLANQYRDIRLRRPAPAISPVLRTFATTTTGKQFEPVDMALLRRLRDAHADPTGRTEAQYTSLIAPLRGYLGGWSPTNPFASPATSLGNGRYRLGVELFAELDAAFKRYVDQLDRGPKLEYLRNSDGSLATATASYTPGDASVGDLDGDGGYELVLKWDPSDAKDSSVYGFAAPTIVDAYKLDGTLLWRVNVGYNIRSGAHDVQLVVADLDSDGRAELLLKTADGTTSGTVDAAGGYTPVDTIGAAGATAARIQGYLRAGDVANLDRFHDALNTYTVGWVLPGGNTPAAQNVRQWGKIYTYGTIGAGNEYVTAFDGRTGRVISTVPYAHPYGAPNWGAAPVDHRGASFATTVDRYWQAPATRWGHYPWGDHQGNRANRFLAGVAYLDGVRPSAILARGYYLRTAVAAYTLVNRQLVLQRSFDSAALPDPWLGEERGGHSLMPADVDNDGRDEIVYGAMVLDDDLSLKTVAGTWFPYPAPAVGPDLTPAIRDPAPTARYVKLAHGDALHVGDLNPARAGVEVFLVQEEPQTEDAVTRGGTVGTGLRPGGGVYDPVTGELRTAFFAGRDNGRGAAGNIDPNSPGAEYWSNGYAYSA
ncbi:MAG TPA: hypothetical protein VF755_20410, partial [Catenuloplanes sp.]